MDSKFGGSLSCLFSVEDIHPIFGSLEEKERGKNVNFFSQEETRNIKQ